VRRALADLADQGYIERRQEAGPFVSMCALPDAVTAGGSDMDGLR
jgi:GntR family transcriptional regulator